MEVKHKPPGRESPMSLGSNVAIPDVLRLIESLKKRRTQGRRRTEDIVRLARDLRRLELSLPQEPATKPGAAPVRTPDLPACSTQNSLFGPLGTNDAAISASLSREPLAYIRSDAVVELSVPRESDLRSYKNLPDIPKASSTLSREEGALISAGKRNESLLLWLPGRIAQEWNRVYPLLSSALELQETICPNSPWPFTPEGVYDRLFQLSGCEIEGQEVSLAILLVTGRDEQSIDRCLTRALGDIRFCTDIPNWGMDGLRDELRGILVPETDAGVSRLIEGSTQVPGGMFSPVLLLGRVLLAGRANTACPLTHCLPLIPEASASNIDDVSVLYERLTEKGDGSVLQRVLVWLKPARAIRIYRDGSLWAHFLRLRKTQRLACRKPSELQAVLYSEMDRRGMTANADQSRLRSVLRRIVSVAVELSEMRVGGAVYIVTPAFFEAQQSALPEVRLIDRYRLARSHDESSPDVLDLPFPALRSQIAQDGATLVSTEGGLLAGAVYFRTGGGRRNTAKDICCSHDGCIRPIVGLVISQDGDVLVTSGREVVDWGDDCAQSPPPL